MTTKFFGVESETPLTTKPHSDDVVCDKQIGGMSFVNVYKGTFHWDDVAIQKMKDIDRSKEAMDKFSKEVAMPDKFRRDNFIHFYGACSIRNHVMLATKVVPCGSLADCIKKQAEPDDRTKMKLMLDPAR